MLEGVSGCVHAVSLSVRMVRRFRAVFDGRGVNIAPVSVGVCTACRICCAPRCRRVRISREFVLEMRGVHAVTDGSHTP